MEEFLFREIAVSKYKIQDSSESPRNSSDSGRVTCRPSCVSIHFRRWFISLFLFSENFREVVIPFSAHRPFSQLNKLIQSPNKR